MADINNGDKNKNWQSFGSLFLISIAVSILLFIGFWYFFGTLRTQTNTKIGTVDNFRQYAQDMFSVAGSIFTVIGYFLTIFQVWKLRTEQETVAATKQEAKYLSFMENTLENIGKAKNSLKELRSRIEKVNSITEEILRSYIDELVEVKEILTKIDVNKKALDNSELCKNCQNLIDICISSFSDSIIEKKTDQIDKVASKGQINAVIQELIKVNPQL